MSAPRFIFAGGGTGGHLYPGLAVAEALRTLEPAAEITFFTTGRPLDATLLGRAGWPQTPQPVRPFTLLPWRWPTFLKAWRQSVRLSRTAFERTRPAAVLGLGGYAAGPPVAAARAMGIPTAILNPDARPGRANRFLASRADLIVTQWEVSRRHFRHGAPVQALGCPIRPGFVSATREAGLKCFGLDPGRCTILVTGASQGARSINRALLIAWPQFATRFPGWQLIHLTGADDEHETKAAYGAADIEAHVLPFTHDMPLALAAADVVVSRAGASTLAELTATGRPSILMPYPHHRDRHQHANAQVLVDSGAALLVEDQVDAGQNAPALLAALEQLADAAMRARMSEAARRLARPDAARSVAQWLAERARA